jgi:hypothetical protein
MKRGKFILHGSGNLKSSMRKAEKAARRSQKRASDRAWKKDTN